MGAAYFDDYFTMGVAVGGGENFSLHLHLTPILIPIQVKCGNSMHLLTKPTRHLMVISGCLFTFLKSILVHWPVEQFAHFVASY